MDIKLKEELDYLENRIKMLESELMYVYKDIANLTKIVENIKPEIHYHLTNVYKSCMDDGQEDSRDIEDYI